MQTLSGDGDMEGVSLVDLFNLVLGAFAVIGAIVYSLIRQKVYIEHMKKQITQLFDLWNSRDK